MTSSTLINDFEEMARERAGGVVSLQLAWSAAFKKLASLTLSDNNARSIARGCTAPRDIELMTALLSRGKNCENVFEEALEDSAYGVDEFFTAMMALCRFLDRDRRQTSVEMVVGYIRCCEDGAADYPAASSLQEVVESMLEDHGFDGVS